MKSRAVNTTKEQDEYRASILKRRVRVKKERVKKVKAAYVWPTDLMTQEEKNGYYIGNCIFWINEYKEGRTDLQRVKTAAKHLIIYLNEPHILNN